MYVYMGHWDQNQVVMIVFVSNGMHFNQKKNVCMQVLLIHAYT